MFGVPRFLPAFGVANQVAIAQKLHYHSRMGLDQQRLRIWITRPIEEVLEEVEGEEIHQ